MKTPWFFLLFFSLGLASINAQDLSNIHEQKPFRLSGNLSMGISYYSSKGIDPRRSPFSWRISGNPVISLYGIKIPLRLAVADQTYSFDQPFQRYGMTPYYKWIKLHLGWSSMRFSPYTFGGRSFFGTGVTLTPGKFKFSAFQGKIEDVYARVDTLIFGAERIKTYERKAYGAKIGVGGRNNYFNIMLVRAQDEINSPVDPGELSSAGLLPEDNLVIGSTFGLRFFKRLRLKFNLAASLFTDNQLEQSLDTEDQFQELFSFFEPTRKSYLSYAGDATLTLHLGKFNLLALYKRVEPRFQTMTTAFIANDYQNYRLQVNTRIFKSLSLQLGAGLQEDNLSQLRKLTTRRLIANVNVNYNPHWRWFINARYSNFNREMSEDIAAINDTLRRVSISGQIGGNIRYVFGPEEKRSNISLNVQNNSIRDLSPIENSLGEVQNLVINFSSNINTGYNNLVLSPSVNYARYSYSIIVEERYGGGLGVSSKINDRLRFSLRSLYNWNDYNQLKNGRILRNSFSLDYGFLENHNLSARLSHIDRVSILRPSFTEWRSSLSYGLKF